MPHVQAIAQLGLLGSQAKKMGHTTMETLPKCESCIFGKQSKNPNPVHHITNDKKEPDGLSLNKLLPGQLVFSDQYISKIKGQEMNALAGRLDIQAYNGGTIFVDAATRYIHLVHQVGFTAQETIKAKLLFEREASEVGVNVLDYHTDNGVYQSAEFLKELYNKGQGICMSGVSA